MTSDETGAGGDEQRGTGGAVNPELLSAGGKVDPQAVIRAAQIAGEDDAEARTVRFVLSRDLRTRLDRYLTSRVTFMSRNQLQRLIESGSVLVNDRCAKPSTKLVKGDCVSVTVPPPVSKDIRPEQIELSVLYEDEHLLVLNKQADIIVHPARSELSGTMVNAVAWHLEHASDSGGGLSEVGKEHARPGVVHRLDRHTSGCIVFAKTEEAHWKLGRQFEFRKVDKRYLAVVHGVVEPGVDVVDLPLGPHPSRAKGYREKYVVRHDHLGKASVTIYRVRERYEFLGEAYSLVELELRTGRTHQIRVHLSELGWSIVGDDMYGGRAVCDEQGEVIMERQALHAVTLGFEHPITGEAMRFVAPVRDEMAGLVGALRRGMVGERMMPAGASVDLELALGCG